MKNLFVMEEGSWVEAKQTGNRAAVDDGKNEAVVEEGSAAEPQRNQQDVKAAGADVVGPAAEERGGESERSGEYAALNEQQPTSYQSKQDSSY